MVKEKLKNHIENNTVEILRMTSKEALKKIQHIKFDFIYIDGNHKYEFVKFDLENYYNLLKSGGYLVGDDYRIESIKTAVLEFVNKNKINNLIIKNDQFVLKKN